MPTALLLSTSLPPNGAPPKLFPTVSLPSNESSFPYRSFPPELSPSYFPRFPFRPPCRHSRIAPSHRSSPQAISHGLPPVHPVVTPVSLLPTGALPKLFPTASLPSTLSHRSSPQAISHGFPSVHPVHPVVIPVSLLPTRLSPSYFTWFPFRPPSCRFRIAPSHPALPKLFHMVSLPSTLLSLPYRSFPPGFPQAISHGFPSVHPLVASVSLLPTGALPKLFHTVSLPSTLSSFQYRSFPPGLSPSYFPRFPFRPPCRHSRIAPSHRSFPQAISHGFPSVHPVVTPVSLLPTGALPELFPTVSLPSTLSSLPYRSFPPSSPQAILHGFPSVHPVVTPVSLLPTGALPTGALPKLFHTVSLPSTLLSSFQYRSFPPKLSPCYFTRFPFRPPCRHSSIAPSHRSSPQAISHGFPSVHPVVTPVSLLPTGALPKLFHTVSLPSVHPVVTPVSLLSTGSLPKLFHTVSLPSTLSSLPYRSFPPELSPSYFPRFPFRPPCRHSRIAPSHRSSPQAISHGFPSVHPVVIPVSLLPTGALPKLFHTVSLPSTLSSFQYRSFPPELSPSYFTRFPFRPPCRHSSIAPSHQSSPQAISHGFPSVHPVVIPVSLLPTGALPKLFHTVSLPSTLSSLPYRSFPPELSPSYFTRFPFRLPCRHSRIAPFHRSSPQAISHGFPSVHLVVTPVSLLPTGALPKLFPTVSLPSTLSSFQYRSFPPELSPSYFTRFPFRPPCRHSSIAPSHRSSPQAISHGFPSVHPVVIPVSLLPTGALPKLFHTVSLPSTLSSFQYRSFPPGSPQAISHGFPSVQPCRHSRIAPSHRSSPHRSSPQAISHGFPSVHPVVIPVSLLHTGALPKLFHTVSLPSTLSSFSHRSSPQAISHGFPSVHPVVTPVSLLPTGALPMLFPTVSSPSTQSLLPSVPSQRSSPHAISHGFLSLHPIVASIRSLPA